MAFPILSIETSSLVGDEQLGSKNKFWFQLNGERWLFKEARPNTGEDWAEKIAGEIAHLVGVQSSRVELAQFNDHRGAAILSFVEGKNVGLVHGNEILAGQIVGYDRTKRLRQSDHTLENIVTAVSRMLDGAEQARFVLQELASYFILDALVCNTDRHHENWGFLLRFEKADNGEFKAYLQVAPSFDHASSLGRELLDDARQQHLQRSSVGTYANRGKGGIFLSRTDRKGANPLDLVRFGIERYPEYFGQPLERFRAAPLVGMLAIVDEVPDSRMSNVAKTFAKELLTFTRDYLVGLHP